MGASSFAESKTVLVERGIFLPTVISIGSVFRGLWTPLARGKRLVGGMSVNKDPTLPFVTELIEAHALQIVVDRRFPLELIQEAHRLVDTGHQKGNVIVEVG